MFPYKERNPVRPKSLYSLHNELSAETTASARLELNPAVVVSDGERRFGLAAVCVGPRLSSTESPLALEVDCDGETIALESLQQRSEASAAGEWLTVALFDTPVELLRRLATGTLVEVALGSGADRLVRALDAANRLNVIRFLGHPDIATPHTADHKAVESVAV